MKQVFIINGSGGSGKDTFVEIVRDIMWRKIMYLYLVIPFPVMNFSSVDKVKEAARIIGWNGGKTEKDRKFLSDLKQLCADYNDMPFNSMKEKVDEFLNSDANFLFLHIREPEEIERAKQAFNAKTMLVKRESIEHITSNMSDGNVFSYNYDIVINNNGSLEDLRKKAKNFLKDFAMGSFKNEY